MHVHAMGTVQFFVAVYSFALLGVSSTIKFKLELEYLEKKYANCTKSLEFGIHWQIELQVKTKFFLLAVAN